MKLAINTKSDTARVNEAQFQEILVNLCSNASHAMQKKGGLLEISLEDETLHLDGSSDSRRYLKFTVSDTGNGMDEEVQKENIRSLLYDEEGGGRHGYGSCGRLWHCRGP